MHSLEHDESAGLPTQFTIGDDINWNAPWADVSLWVELPFWLMVNNSSFTINYQGCNFPIATHDNYFELHCGEIADSRRTVLYRGPFKERDKLSDNIRQILTENPELSVLWRKCKTILKIKSRCNQAVWEKDDDRPFSYSLYMAELCRAHLPIVNQLIKSYRLATYDYFAFELSPWDVPFWNVERAGQSVSCMLVPYHRWDIKPPIILKEDEPPVPYQLIEGQDLASQISVIDTPGEFDLLDALNLMERGDYSGAVRRITTAIEVVLESAVRREVHAAEGKSAAARFFKRTKTNFPLRLAKYRQLSNRALSTWLEKELASTRNLRHGIVHGGHRVDRGRAQRSVDTGRWIFNWVENDQTRARAREKRIGFRSLGRDMYAGIFPTKITPDGVIVYPLGKNPGG
jgi:hypothetical protein